jgi:hypothetical protein
MNTRRLVTATLYPSIFLAGCFVAWTAAVGLAGGETIGTASVMDARAPLPKSAADSTQAPQTSQAPQASDVSRSSEPPQADAMTAAMQPASEPQKSFEVASADPTEIMVSETAPAVVTSAASSVEVLDECYVVDACVDRYLWALYQRTPKEDSIKQSERRAVQVRKKHKMVTVTRTFTKLVDEDFAWKDPKAADKSGMPMMDYVIGGMDRGFKLKLFRALLAAEAAGLSPGITSAFRDDYRQSIASGLKAATDRSFHGGSFRGGYGHGLAADIVSVNGKTRAQRWVSTENLWKWVDAHGKEFGIARPYLDRDPPHVAPVDGQEYAKHRGGGDTERTASNVKKKKHLATRERGTAGKQANIARPSKVKTSRSAQSNTAKRIASAR